MIESRLDHIEEMVRVPSDTDERRRFTILHSAETALGGVGSYIEIVCQATRGQDNIVLVPEGQTRLIDASRRIVVFPRKRRGLATIWSQCTALLRLYDEVKPDIVFLHSTFSLVPLLVLTTLRPSAVTLYCAHGWAVSQYEHRRARSTRLVSLIEGTLAGRAKRVINISKHDQKIAVERGYFGRHILIENAVPDAKPTNARIEPRPDPEKLNLLFVGRHDEQKGLDVLLEAFALALEHRKDLALYVVGSAVREETGTIDLPEGAVSVGWVDPHEIDAWFAACDAIVVPSRWEGFGLVVAEAFRNGTPALVSNRGALPDLVSVGVTGDVFDLSVEELTGRLTELSKTELHAQREACRRAYEERFSQDRFATAIESVYENVLLEA